MNVARARYLASADGRLALRAVPDEFRALSPTTLAARLRREMATAAAAAIGEQIELQAKAGEKLGDGARDWLLAPELLEMMTHPLVAARRAARLRAGGRPVLDLTCGLGGDLRAVDATGAATFGMDRDPAAAVLAKANVPGASVAVGDATRVPFRLTGSAVLLDPSRRAGRGRTFDPRAFSPPWDTAIGLAREGASAVVKAPPGIDHSALPHDSEAEFVQLGRVLRECAVWLGEGAEPGLRRAVLLPGGHTLDSTGPECSPSPVEPGAVVLDPQSCVTRAGLVRQLGARVGARLLDSAIAYLTCDHTAADPLAETFEVLDVIRFSVDGVRKRLREAGWAPRDIRRRGFPVEPMELQRLLGRFEGDPVTLLCTTLAGRRTILVVRPLAIPK